MAIRRLLAAAIVAALLAPAHAYGKTASQTWVQGKVNKLKEKDKKLHAKIKSVNTALRTTTQSSRAYPRVVGAVSRDAELGECTPLAEWADGDIALCIGRDIHVGDPIEPNDDYGHHYFLWLETVVPLQRVQATYETIEPTLGCDEVVGNCLGDPDFSRFILTFASSGEVAGGIYGDNAAFLAEDGTLIQMWNFVVACPYDQDCFASAVVAP